MLRMFYLEFHLRRFAESILKLTQKCQEYAISYKKPVMHWPTAIFAFNLDHGDTDGKPSIVKAMRDLEEDVESGMTREEDFVETEIRDPDHLPPRRVSRPFTWSRTSTHPSVVPSHRCWLGILL